MTVRGAGRRHRAKALDRYRPDRYSPSLPHVASIYALSTRQRRVPAGRRASWRDPRAGVASGRTSGKDIHEISPSSRRDCMPAHWLRDDTRCRQSASPVVAIRSASPPGSDEVALTASIRGKLVRSGNCMWIQVARALSRFWCRSASLVRISRLPAVRDVVRTRCPATRAARRKRRGSASERALRDACARSGAYLRHPVPSRGRFCPHVRRSGGCMDGMRSRALAHLVPIGACNHQPSGRGSRKCCCRA